MTMYIFTRAGTWATHRDTPTGKTKTGIQLYTLEEALALGYTPPAKPEKKEAPKSGRQISVEIFHKPAKSADFITIGKYTLDDGSSFPIGFSTEPSQGLKSYREKGSQEYSASRLQKNPQGKWVKVIYENGVGFAGLPLQRDDRKEALYNKTELADRVRSNRTILLDKNLGLIQDLLTELSTEGREIKVHGKTKKVRFAPHNAPWMQEFFDRRIEITQKTAELFHLYKTWKNNRFEGDQTCFDELEQLMVQDAHLAAIESAHREKWKNKRDDQYKKLAYRIVMQAKDGGSISIRRPPLKQKGQKEFKHDLMTEEQASKIRRFTKSAAALSFCKYLELAAKREGLPDPEITEIGEHPGDTQTPDPARNSNKPTKSKGKRKRTSPPSGQAQASAKQTKEPLANQAATARNH